jgi:type VI secretion system secreted protein VgrG
MAQAEPAREAKFLFEVKGASFETSVLDFMAIERISSPFELNVSLVSEDDIKFDDVVGKEAFLTILGDDGDRYCHGMINQFMQTGSKGNYYLYQTRVVPTMWLLSLEQDSRIFQNKNVPDIVKQILQDGGITSDRFDFRVQNQYQPREYCVQYRETDLNFISRLLEEEGIFYFFEHSKDKHVLVFGDSTAAYQPIQGNTDVTFNPASAMVPGEEFVYDFALSQRILSGKVTQKDFNFEKPSLDLTAKEQDKSYQKLERYDYPGRYQDQGRGKKLTQVRLQESMTFKEKAEGHSVCPRFIPCFKFKLTDHDRQSFNQEYLLVEVVHTGSQPQVLKEQAVSGGPFSYSNDFLGIPSSVTLRPERKTPKSIVEGTQTAMIVGPKGEEIYTDKYGRVKVQFHWDREGSQDEKSSCWIRVASTFAGGNYGAIFTPRIGQEVIVDFLEGDPDQPIITGRVYNADNMPPYDLPKEKTKSTIKSNSSIGGKGFNEIRFEDEKDKEQIFIHAERNQDIRVENDLYEWIGNESHLIVKKDQLEMVEGDKHLTVKGDSNEKVDGTLSLKVGMDMQEKVGMKHALDAGMEIHLKAGMNVVLEAGMSITLKAGGGFVVVGPAGVTISGTPVLINSGGAAGTGSGCSPAAPKEPQEADKAQPGKDSKLPSHSGALSPQAQALKNAAQSGTPFCQT